MERTEDCFVLSVFQYWINEFTSSLGIGVFHSGIEIYGRGKMSQKYDATSVFISVIGRCFNTREAL